MRKIIFLLLLIAAVSVNIKAQLPAYNFPTPAGWGTEKFTLPPAFAPEIKFIGTEDIRFTPGWSKAGTNDYWSYAFLWLVEGAPAINETLLTNYMTAYYTGIYNTNLGNKPKPVPGFTAAKFTKTKPLAGDLQTFEGTVTTLNFLNQDPLKLNLRIHVKKSTAAYTAILFGISPKPYADPVWKGLNEVVSGFVLVPAKYR